MGRSWVPTGCRTTRYRLVTPVTAPIVLVGDLVEVVSSGAQGCTGRVWLVDDSTEASTWEICRSTRLMERVTV
ncbi:DUF6093 family protein [Streptomyces sp. NPDC059757]|uniref:DUF6093 family protein n=1 Tax=Streptomyces sp. NPDC059757 TaxID=3346935 RepID=UPI00364DA416